MEAFIFIIFFYVLLWPLGFFQIAVSSLRHYVVKFDVSKPQLEKFVQNLNFPFSLLNAPAAELSGTSTHTVLEKLDQIKTERRSYRFHCLYSSTIPTICLLVFVFGLYRSPDTESRAGASTMIILISVSLFVTWRFGHKLKQPKSSS